MATSIGVRSCTGMIPVPRSSDGAAAPTAASVAKDSEPVVSAIQNEGWPTDSASCAISTAARGPSPIRLPKVTPVRSIPMAGDPTALLNPDIWGIGPGQRVNTL